MRPQALGYPRVQPDLPPAVAARLADAMRCFAHREGLTLANVYTEPFDPHLPHLPLGPAFCALLDALRSQDVYGVLIPSWEHLSCTSGQPDVLRTMVEEGAGAGSSHVRSSGRALMKHSMPTSYAVRHRLAYEGLADALDAVLDGDLVGDRAIAERLVRILAAARDLCEMRNVDGRGRCATCWTMPRRWWRPWPRRSLCSVYTAFVTERADGTGQGSPS